MKDEIEKLYKEGLTYTEIGKRFGFSRQRVHQIRTGYTTNKLKPIEQLTRMTQRKRIALGIMPSIPKERRMGSVKVRALVRGRDRQKCVLCGKEWKKGKRVFDVHHMDAELEGKGIFTPDMIPRLITLCHRCHITLPHVRKKQHAGSLLAVGLKMLEKTL